MPRRLTAPVACALLLAAAPAVPPAIAVPAGHRLLLSLHATGVQVYQAVPSKAGPPEWTLDGPLATLTDDAGRPAGYHYDGPSWESIDGSKLARDPAQPVRSAPAPDAARDVPWLLVKVTADARPGTLSTVAYVQRVDTAGGKPPARPPARAGTKVGVPYTATYRFYAPGD